MTFTQRVARNFLVIKAARQIKQEIERTGLDTFTTLADAGHSIFGTYLNGCSPQEKARLRRDFNTLLQMGVTLDMVLSELIRQMPMLLPIMGGKDDYRKSEIEQIMSFLREG